MRHSAVMCPLSRTVVITSSCPFFTVGAILCRRFISEVSWGLFCIANGILLSFRRKSGSCSLYLWLGDLSSLCSPCASKCKKSPEPRPCRINQAVRCVVLPALFLEGASSSQAASPATYTWCAYLLATWCAILVCLHSVPPGGALACCAALAVDLRAAAQSKCACNLRGQCMQAQVLERRTSRKAATTGPRAVTSKQLSAKQLGRPSQPRKRHPCPAHTAQDRAIDCTSHDA